jgi:hypothetical protein
MRMKRIFVLASLLALSLAAAGPVFSWAQSNSAQGNPDIGVWKLNVAKSKYVPGPGPRSQTRTVVPLPQGGGVKVTIEGVSGSGKTINYTYNTNYGGADSPLTGVGFPSDANTIAVKRINANTTTQTDKKDGQVILQVTRVVSKEGKVETIHGKGKGITNLVVYEKQ